MAERTRIVRLASDADRVTAPNEVTRFFGAPLRRARPSLSQLFNQDQGTMACALAEERRPGLFVFALGFDGPRLPRLWLSASEALRAGTIGRHSRVDLFLPGDDGLSLRHCLVLVHRAEGRVHTQVVDLDSEAGLSLEDARPIEAVESDGVFFLGVPGGTLAFIPTGDGAPWDRSAGNPFETLPRREVDARPRGPRLVQSAPPADRRSEVTAVRVLPGPLAPRPNGGVLAPGEVPIGMLELIRDGFSTRFAVGARALERGILLGRYARCLGSSLLHDEPEISRIHALIALRSGQLLLADAGSSNGVFAADGHRVRCEGLVPGERYVLPRENALRWLSVGGLA